MTKLEHAGIAETESAVQGEAAGSFLISTKTQPPAFPALA